MAIGLKQATIEDVHQLREMLLTTFHDTFAHLNNEDDLQTFYDKAYTIEQLEVELKNPGSIVYFAVENEIPMGFIKINFYGAQTEPGHEHGLELERIYVLPDHQDKGVGSVLFKKVFEIADEHQHKYIWLGVWEKNERAIQIYEKKGFKQFGSHDFWVGQDRQTDLLMRLDL